MVKNFYDCAKQGGKVINKKTKDGKVTKTCYDKEGNSYIKPDKKKKNKKNNRRFMKATESSLNKLAAHFNNNKLN